ncbi:hypothetical protein [Bifidobacterium tibiigranuli]|nr:hypothetical protein [Bifidobacterium tibiigranuli]
MTFHQAATPVIRSERITGERRERTQFSRPTAGFTASTGFT